MSRQIPVLRESRALTSRETVHSPRTGAACPDAAPKESSAPYRMTICGIILRRRSVVRQAPPCNRAAQSAGGLPTAIDTGAVADSVTTAVLRPGAGLQ